MRRKQGVQAECLADRYSGPDALTILSAVAGEVTAVDRRGVVVYTNAPGDERRGGSSGEHRGSNIGRTLVEKLATTMPPREVEIEAACRGLEDVLAGRAASFSGVFPNTPPAEGRWFKLDIKPLRDGGAVLLQVDVTDLRRAEERALYLASHDALTGLANRSTFRSHMELALARAWRTGSRFGLLLLDLDDFKAVNDTHGHLVGDKLLTTVGSRLRQRMRRSDTVARLGGDEFGLLVNDVASENDLCCVGREIVDLLRPPAIIDGLRISVRASVGLAAYPVDGDAVDMLLKAADAALYAAKRSGRDGWRWTSDRHVPQGG